MANYTSKTRTNYFRVTDAGKLESIVSRIIGDKAEHITIAANDGQKYHMFYLYGSISGLLKEGAEEAQDEDYDDWLVYEAIQEIIPEGEAVVIEEIGSEKMRYLTAFAVIITRDDIRCVNLKECIKKEIHEIPGFKDYVLNDEY